MRVSTEILISVLRIAAAEEDSEVNKSKFIMAADRLGELNARIKRLEEELMDTKNNYAVLVADVVLRDDKLERIKQLEDRIERASIEFFRDRSDGQVASSMLSILGEERNKP